MITFDEVACYRFFSIMKCYLTVEFPAYCPIGTSVCPGDSGGGIAFERDQKYYLRGIVSVGLEPEGDAKCFTDQYTAFTKVSDFLTWMEDNIKLL
jgi:secreted trypsin-like serine protease